MNINFYLERRKDKESDIPVLIQITFDNKRYKTNTGIKADKLSHWNQKKQSFLPSSPNAAKRNQTLKLKREQIESIYLEGVNTNAHITPGYIAERFHSRIKEGFFDLFQTYINEGQTNSGWSANTKRHFEIVKRILDRLQGEGVEASFKAIDDKWHQKIYEKFLEKGSTVNTAKHYLACIDMFLRWVTEKKGIAIKDVGKFKIKDKAEEIRKGSKAIVYLEPGEFMTMVKAKFTGTIALVRDIFIVQCSTGLRISDTLNLRASDIKEDHISLITQKTNTAVEIPLNTFSKAIFERYKGLPTGAALPDISRQKVNDYLKLIAKRLEFDREVIKATTQKGQLVISKKPLHELISSHAGRRTFVSLGVALKMDEKTMMEFTTHKTQAIFRGYQGVSDKDKRRAMDNFSEKQILKIV